MKGLSFNLISSTAISSTCVVLDAVQKHFESGFLFSLSK
jgi:hypothetical protein